MSDGYKPIGKPNMRKQEDVASPDNTLPSKSAEGSKKGSVKLNSNFHPPTTRTA